MTRELAQEDRLARLAARGRAHPQAAEASPTQSRSGPSATGSTSSGAWTAPRPPSLGPHRSWAVPGAVHPGPAYAGSVDPRYPTVGLPGMPAVPGMPGRGEPTGLSATRRTTSVSRPTQGRHHPARRSRLATAGVSTALLFGGIGYLSATQVFADTQPAAANQGTDAGQLGAAGGSTDGESDTNRPADGQLGGDDPVSGVAPVNSEPAGTLPATVAPAPGSATGPTTLGPAPASVTPAAVDPAAAVAPAVDPGATDPAAADRAAVDPAAADPAPTDPPTTVRRTPRTAPARPRCTGSHC